MENQSSDSPMASSSSRPSPSSTNSTSSRFQLPPFKNFIDALTPSSSFRHLQLSAERDYGGRGAPDEPDDSGPNRLLNMLPVSVARPPSRTTSSHVRGRARTDSNASSSAPTLSHRYGSPPPSQPYSASASASASTSMMRMTAKGTNVIEDGTGMKTTRSDERQFQREREQQQQPQHYSLSDAPPPPPMTIPAQMNRDLFPPRRTYRRRSPSLQSHYERYPAASSSDEYHSSPAAGTQAQAQVQASPRSSSSSSHIHSASGPAASASTHSRLPPHHSEQSPSLPPPPFPRPPFSPEHGVSHHQRQTTSTSQSQSQTAEGARGARRDSSLSSSLTPFSFPPDGHPSTSGAHSAIHVHGMDLHSPPLPPPPSGAGAAQYQSRSHGLSSGSVSQLEPSPSSSPSGGGGGTAPHYLTTSQERVLPPRQNHHHPRGSGYPTATAPEPPAPPASPAAAGYGRGRGRDQPLARNRPPTDIGDRASVAVVRHRYDSPPLPWTSDTSHQRSSGMTYMEDERQSSSGGSGSSRHLPASASAPLESHTRDERRAKVAFQYEDAYNIIPGTSRQTVERDRSRSGTITGPSHRPLEESSSHLGPDRSSRPPPASSSTMSVDDARSSSSYAQSPGAGQSSVKAPFLREISGRENIAKGQMALNQLIRHKSKEDLSRVLTELSNEARYAVQEGNTLKKLQEFTYAICQFAAFYAHSEDQSGVTPEDVEEMTHRADLVHRMAQHLLVQMKENARPKKEEPVTFTSLKAKPKLTKSEQDTLDMMTEIARSRNFSKQGGKSKYQKRNKKTQPPKLCSSCKIKETPEWRKGPEGPRTLCNACGLHWAKLMRNRNASGAKWIGDGPQPPIDIITLRQVTGVGPQLQASESGEFEMPGIYTNIPANRLLGEQHLPRPRAGRASLAGSPANEASVSSTSGVTPQTQKNEMEVGLSQATEATTMASASQPPPPPPSTVESMEESMTNEEPPSSPIEQASGKKRKAESDLDDEDMTDPDGAHSAKRQRR